MTIEFLHIISVYYDTNPEFLKYLECPYILFYKEHSEKEPYNNKNIGGAETNILKYIKTHYHNLPDICVFTHPFNIKWTHNGNLYDCINELFKTRKKLDNFGPICNYPPRLDVFGNQSVKYNFMKKTGWWDDTMRPYFGELPENAFLNKLSTGQFYVRKQTIHRLPLQFYENMYNWLMTKSIPNTLHINSQDNVFYEFWTTRFMEWSWEYIFTANLKY